MCTRSINLSRTRCAIMTWMRRRICKRNHPPKIQRKDYLRQKARDWLYSIWSRLEMWRGLSKSSRNSRRPMSGLWWNSNRWRMRNRKGNCSCHRSLTLLWPKKIWSKTRILSHQLFKSCRISTTSNHLLQQLEKLCIRKKRSQTLTSWVHQATSSYEFWMVSWTQLNAR